jgi:hypothetical protein
MQYHGCKKARQRGGMSDRNRQRVNKGADWHIPTVECNNTAAKKHVSEAECPIETAKECTRRALIGKPTFSIIYHDG